MKPEPVNELATGSALGRMSLSKVFHGQLEATSVGEFVSAMGAVKGSAGYVAMEQVTGTLDGIAGSFVLQHSGTITRGVPALAISVVPDSGAGGLIGLSGSMKIDVVEKQHHYEFRYELGE
jgi:hypothetical protein